MLEEVSPLKKSESDNNNLLKSLSIHKKYSSYKNGLEE